MKLVRDIEAEDKRGTHFVRHAGAEERWQLLREKLLDEAKLLLATTPGGDEEIEQLINVIEVVKRMTNDIEIAYPGTIKKVYDKALQERGELGFLVVAEKQDLI